jgi:hypothetical protein
MQCLSGLRERVDGIDLRTRQQPGKDPNDSFSLTEPRPYIRKVMESEAETIPGPLVNQLDIASWLPQNED